MPRSVPAGRFEQLVEVATKTFVTRGYRLTQMADVAEALGVAKGTLYGYVDSKDALFDAAVRYADGQVPMPQLSELPLPTPKAGSTLGYVRDRIGAEARELALLAALATNSPPKDGAAEFANVVRDLYRLMARHRRAIKLVDRCAVDHPGLASVWFDEGRWSQVALIGEYLQQRIAAGKLRAVPSVPIAARYVLETIATWAIHMPWDPSPRPFADADVENTVVDMLMHAFAKE